MLIARLLESRNIRSMFIRIKNVWIAEQGAMCKASLEPNFFRPIKPIAREMKLSAVQITKSRQYPSGAKYFPVKGVKPTLSKRSAVVKTSYDGKQKDDKS